MELTYPRIDGTYYLSEYPDCEGGHHGQYEGLSIYAVARGGKNERLFMREDLAAASAYQNTLDPRPGIEKLSTSSICDQAVLDLFEGRLVYT